VMKLKFSIGEIHGLSATSLTGERGRASTDGESGEVGDDGNSYEG
jgi:hypothetical protein